MIKIVSCSKCKVDDKTCATQGFGGTCVADNGKICPILYYISLNEDLKKP